MRKQIKFAEGSVQRLMLYAAEKRPEPYVITDFLIFNDAVVTFEITVKIIKETFATKESHESTVDEIKRYREEYAEQGNEDVKEPIKEGQ